MQMRSIELGQHLHAILQIETVDNCKSSCHRMP